MLIYSFQRVCYHCKNKIKTYTYVQYKAFYGDVEFPYSNWMMAEVYAHIHPDSPCFDKTSYALNYPVYTLGDNLELDKILIESG